MNAEYCPLVQLPVHAEEVEPPVPKCPEGQLWHDDDPATEEYLPPGQVEQLEAATPDKPFMYINCKGVIFNEGWAMF